LINAHCHLDYTCLRGTIPRQNSFADWIRAINAEKGKLGADDYRRSISDGFREAREFGTSSLVNLTDVPELISRLEGAPLRTWWCPELLDIRPGATADQLLQFAAAATGQTRYRGLAPHAPYTASAQLYRAVDRARDFLPTTHVAESFEELQMFRFATGPLYDFLASIGRDMSDCGRRTPFAHLLELIANFRRGAGDTSRSPWLVVHVNELVDDDWERIARLPPLHVVHCPRSHRYFQHTRFAYERLRDNGANICLGTDSLASAPDLSLFAEMREFRRLRPHVSAREVIELATINGARALGQGAGLGQLSAGAFADMIAFPFSGDAVEAYETIVGFDHPVSWTMIGGELV
ncbi:MAG: amidohydrolase family protein, partial [Chthoniobacterales bacterium]